MPRPNNQPAAHSKQAPGSPMLLTREEREALGNVRVFAKPWVSVVRTAQGQGLLRGVESGGSGRAVGAYVGFVPVEGCPFQNRGPVAVFANKADHAFVLGKVLMRVEVFRFSGNFHCEITLHILHDQPAKNGEPARDRHERVVIFRRHAGGVMRRNQMPEFLNEAGEKVSVPDFALPAFRAAYEGAMCLECDKRHAHMKDVPAVVFTEGLRQAFHLPPLAVEPAPEVAKPAKPANVRAVAGKKLPAEAKADAIAEGKADAAPTKAVQAA